MKILMFGWEFPPYISGGLGTACYGMTQALCQMGMKITFVLPKIKGGLGDNSPVEVVGANQVSEEIIHSQKMQWESKLKLLEVNSSLLPYMNEETYVKHIEEVRKHESENKSSEFRGIIDLEGDYGHDLLGEVYRYSMIGSFLGKKPGYHIIHAHDWMTYPAGIEAKKSSGLPLIVHVHATEFDRSGETPNIDIYNIEKWGMEEADVVIAVSQRTKNLIVEKYGIDYHKVHVVHNAVTKEKTLDKSEAPKFLKEKIVLFLGRVTMQKGPDYFIEAAHEVLKKVKNVRFVMAGAGDMLPRMIERAAELRMQDKFHFTGFLRGVQREKIFSMCDLYVMPSVSEPFGITPFEVMKYGVPIIVSKQSGITEVIENLIKVDFWDINKLASSITNVLSDSSLSSHLVERSSRELESIDWSNSASLISHLYYEVAKI